MIAVVRHQAQSLRYVLIAVLASLPPVAAAEPITDDTGLFERKIRPVLTQHCYRCHSAEATQLKGGLRLDDRETMRRGGNSGLAIVPGRPEQSRLIRALQHTDPGPRMPPSGKLPDAVIADFARWITEGATDPRAVSSNAGTGSKTNAAKSHWAFQPIREVVSPSVTDESWSRTPVDRFILATLEKKGLSPSPPADKRTLIRRAYFDLIGLPTGPEEVDEFIADQSPGAFERVVDRLLASPHYGERWGRHWLDVARYADTKDGVLMYGDDRIRPFAYTYRDYVIRAFNDDVPFDRFIHEQLAADLIEPKPEPLRLAAMGFLTLGRQFDNNIHDVIDDQIDTVSRGLFGLTVSCARCHDHKYDPIPIADYYSLYGVFASSTQPIVLPLVDDRAPSGEAAKFEEQYAAKQREIELFLETQFGLLSQTARRRVGDYLVHVATTKPDPMETAIYFLSQAPEDLRLPIIARWRSYLEKRARPDDPVFAIWHDLFNAADADFSSRAPQVLERLQKRETGTHAGQINSLVRDAFSAASLTCKADVAKVYGELLKRLFEEPPPAKPTPDDAARHQLSEVILGPESPAFFPKHETRNYMSRGDKDAYGSKLLELDRVAVKNPHALPRAMILVDGPELQDPHTYIRGNPARRGERVPRQFLSIIEGKGRKPFANGSGRLDLAHAITAHENPLTSRVIVNRIWMHHFGAPLVDTPNDLGTRAGPPSHPELLDFLAGTFQREGWSIKSMHRLIMLSNVYQQASFDRPDCRETDPDNRFFWRMNRRRLEWEPMRDTLLAVAGQLDRKLGGRPSDVAGDPVNGRRTVYGFVDRQSLPGVFRAFDFASPDQSAERRPHTTTPQQALFAMNSPFMLERAKDLAARPEIMQETQPARRVAALYRLVLNRPATPSETQAALEFIESRHGTNATPEKSTLDPWQQYAQVLLLTNEFIFVD